MESCAGAHLVNQCMGKGIEVQYWREGNYEVDYVLKKGEMTIAIEITSGARHHTKTGMSLFSEQFNPQRSLLVGTGGIALVEFLQTAPENWFTID